MPADSGVLQRTGLVQPVLGATVTAVGVVTFWGAPRYKPLLHRAPVMVFLSTTALTCFLCRASNTP